MTPHYGGVPGGCKLLVDELEVALADSSDDDDSASGQNLEEDAQSECEEVEGQPEEGDAAISALVVAGETATLSRRSCGEALALRCFSPLTQLPDQAPTCGVEGAQVVVSRPGGAGAALVVGRHPQEGARCSSF